MQISGIIPPIVTPLLPNEDLDLPRLRSLIDTHIELGMHGIFVLGTTGECYALSESEKQEVMATAVQHVAGRVPVFAGTGVETTREAIRLTQIAYREGVNGVSVITPYYIAPSQAELIDYYRRVAESVSMPVLLYSNPAMSGGVKLDVDTVAKLAEVPNIVGIKDSSGDLQHLIELVKATPNGFAVLQGRDTLIYAALMMGAAGAVPGCSNVAPELALAIYRAFASGDLEGAKTAQAKFSPIRLALAMFTAPGGVKAAMNALGMHVGPSRGPIAPPTPEKVARMQQVLRQIGLLVD
ncbi:4-hydroxy-tetrahydrodipicolinate synthase [Tuwongella immobilis]|uniref:4-hydroxy-tetrahydrodipicolinate synthase n=1 Tax=Tuwongella immobilis TaxID=692036 RepID=A0A6C2YMU5_9BACT|nr:4-hydroxy-tetrahydrodipicolinate synthase [Tuwongella immobilis]VIP02756.1 dihydrodipicolinate synthase : 4-hydroxy-tetrahydrodipicolinate synthase OS=Acetonema longum DSM 6540 GN=dapA PE=3 SV=1: DHDPS [Tuwongella immobilis]VTS02357.1 dihydrodipicolinate synthase : 4-hydroxy-tetrahydrodipicolinate synthase OS=Acetonema longum DSM 6540 GN=dapA PE=3 SV=1: DHDPS [Tuwongella immobilis]